MAQSDAERMRAYRARKRAEEEGALSDAEEQALRDLLGYAPSETRTARERSDAAARMLGRDPDDYWESRAEERARLLERVRGAAGWRSPAQSALAAT